MSLATLVEAVEKFAAASHPLTEHYLNQPSYQWEDYESVRYGFLHTTLELRQLAAHLLQQRIRSGQYPNYAQHALVRHQQAYREMLALLIGINDEEAARPPAPHEWPLQTVVLHMLRTERYFYATIRKALEAQINREEAEPIRDDEVWQLAEETGERETEETPLSELRPRFEKLHHRVTTTLAKLSDGQTSLPSPMWENTIYPIRFRLQEMQVCLR